MQITPLARCSLSAMSSRVMQLSPFRPRSCQWRVFPIDMMTPTALCMPLEAEAGHGSLGMRASCRRSFSTEENLLGMSRLFSLPTARTWFNRRCQTKARRPLRDVGAQVSLVRDEGLKAGHDALPASAGCPEGGSYLSATRVGCGRSLGCWGHWEDNQGRGRSSFFVVQFLWDHPR